MAFKVFSDLELKIQELGSHKKDSLIANIIEANKAYQKKEKKSEGEDS